MEKTKKLLLFLSKYLCYFKPKGKNPKYLLHFFFCNILKKNVDNKLSITIRESWLNLESSVGKCSWCIGNLLTNTAQYTILLCWTFFSLALMLIISLPCRSRLLCPFTWFLWLKIAHLVFNQCKWLVCYCIAFPLSLSWLKSFWCGCKTSTAPHLWKYQMHQFYMALGCLVSILGFLLPFSHALLSQLLLFNQHFAIKQFFRCNNTEIWAKHLGTMTEQTLVMQFDPTCLGSSLSPGSPDFPIYLPSFPQGVSLSFSVPETLRFHLKTITTA